MIITIDTSVQRKLDLNPTQYAVCQMCALYAPLQKGTGVSHVSEVLNADQSTITKSMRHLIDVGLLSKADNGFYYPTQNWYLAHDGEEVIVKGKHDYLAISVIELFNKVNNTKYQLPANMPYVIKLLKANPHFTIVHFESVITHKAETWGKDEKMAEYNRPSTIFSSKFLKYLDEATHYWLKYVTQ